MVNMMMTGREDEVTILKKFDDKVVVTRLVGPFVELL